MKVMFAGGGTGGHINPALSIANYIKEKDDNFEAVFIGTERGLEKRLIPEAGYPIKYIKIEGFDRKNLLKNIKVLNELRSSVKECKKIIREFKPDCIVCTGGYVSGPVAIAAKKMKVPSLIHEQNVYPGLTVRGSEKYVDYVAVSFDDTIHHMKNKKKCVVTGNPIRPEILDSKRDLARRILGIGDKKFLLIFGGSLGAEKINESVIDMLEDLSKDSDIKVLFGTGERGYKTVMSHIKERNIELGDNINIVPYINDMNLSMAAADLAVTRSGAITVSELAVLGIPAVLIPSPHVVRNHQEQNAREIESHGGAVVITETELESSTLYNNIKKLIHDEGKLKKMSRALHELAKCDALDKIYDLMKKMTSK